MMTLGEVTEYLDARYNIKRGEFNADADGGYITFCSAASRKLDNRNRAEIIFNLAQLPGGWGVWFDESPSPEGSDRWCERWERHAKHV